MFKEIEKSCLSPLKIPTALGLGAAFGDGKQGQSWIHISDVVGVFLKACNEQWEGVFNLVAPNPVSQTDFIKALAKALVHYNWSTRLMVHLGKNWVAIIE